MGVEGHTESEGQEMGGLADKSYKDAVGGGEGMIHPCTHHPAFN
jgi:hypothetical protein